MRLCIIQGIFEANFVVVIPYSVLGPAGKEARVVQYGHGLFQDFEEATDDYLLDIANELGYIFVCTDWLGLSSSDQGDVITMLSKSITDFKMIPDRTTQGVVNHIMLMRALKGPSGSLLKNTSLWDVGGINVNKMDGERRSFLGQSAGGILGGVYMAVTTDIVRGQLTVPGGPFELILPRSRDFGLLGQLLELRYAKQLDLSAMFGVLQVRAAIETGCA